MSVLHHCLPRHGQQAHCWRFLQVIKFPLSTVFVVFTCALTRAIVTMLSHASCSDAADSHESDGCSWMLGEGKKRLKLRGSRHVFVVVLNTATLNIVLRGYLFGSSVCSRSKSLGHFYSQVTRRGHGHHTHIDPFSSRGHGDRHHTRSKYLACQSFALICIYFPVILFLTKLRRE